MANLVAGAGPTRSSVSRRSCSIVLLAVISVSTLPAQTPRDSAGIRIVENTRPVLPAARAWRLSSQPRLQIGNSDASTSAGRDTVYDFMRVMGVAKLADGRIAVGNQATSTIRFFDANGKFVASAGRKGQGPGEFQQILGLRAVRGDTLVISDNGEMEYFTGDGRHVRRGAWRGTGDIFIYPSAILPDGSYLGIEWNERRAAREGRWTDSLWLIRVSSDGLRFDTLGRTAAGQRAQHPVVREGYPVTFGPTPRLTTSNDGFYLGYTDRYEIRAYALSGTARRAIRRSESPRPVSRTMVDEYKKRFMGMSGENNRPLSPALKAHRARLADGMPFAERFPSFSTLLGDRLGNLWVKQYQVEEHMTEASGPVSIRTFPEPSRWDVFDPAGRWLCTVTMPASFTPLEIGSDYVAGLWRDDDDVEFVRIYGLVKP